MDWLDQTLARHITVEMVSPQNLDSVIGELEGADLGSSSLSAAYYTDTRTSGRLSLVDSNWQRGSFLRFTAHVGDWSGVLGTYAVSDDSATRRNGAWSLDLDLQSMLWALSLDKAKVPMTLAPGASAMDAAARILDASRFAYSIDGNDAVSGAAKVYESGLSALEKLFSLADMSGNRVDVDCYGTVTVRRYANPDAKPAAFTIDLADPRGIAEDGLQFSSDFLSMPTQYALVYRWNEGSGDASVQREWVAWADREGRGSAAQRGYTVTDFQVLDDDSYAAIGGDMQAEASRLLAESRERVEWRLSTCFLPVWEGDTLDLLVHDGDAEYTGRRHCLVKNVELDLRTLHMDLTLKETASGDTE